MTYKHRAQYHKFNAAGSRIYFSFIFLRPTYVRPTEDQYLWSYTSQANPIVQLEFRNYTTNIT